MPSSSARPYSWPITRATARALPPVASAISGCGGSRSASPVRTALSRGVDLSGGRRIARQAERRSGAANRGRRSAPTPARAARCRRRPRSSRHRRRRPRPPPSPGFARETAPVNASRPSSSAETTRTSAPVAWPIVSIRRSGESPCRPGRGDDGLELADAELAGDPGVLARHLADLVELPAPHAAVVQDLLARGRGADALLAQRANRVAGHGCDEQAHRVRAHVDHSDPHARHSREHPGQTPRALVTGSACRPPCACASAPAAAG